MDEGIKQDITSFEDDALKKSQDCATYDNTSLVKPFLQTYKVFDNEGFACGISLLGRVHQRFNEGCQDYHLFSDLGDNWHLYIVSDGAGSASASDRGSKWNCLIAEYLIKGMLERVDWKNRKQLPSELEWYQEFVAICRKSKIYY